MKVAPDEQAAARRLQFAAIVGKATEGWIELRYARPRGMRQEFFLIGQHSEAAKRAGELGRTTDVYVGAVPRTGLAGHETLVDLGGPSGLTPTHRRLPPRFRRSALGPAS